MPQPYYSETAKAIEIINGKYLEGHGADIGCGSSKLSHHAIGVDGRDLEGVDIITSDPSGLYPFKNGSGVMPNTLDYIYSSHFLEHWHNPLSMISNWWTYIKLGGFLVLYLPDGRYYSNENNPEHLYDWNYESFLFFFKRCFCGEGKDFKGDFLPKFFEVIESGVDLRPDCYSFYLVAQKL